MLNSWRYEKRFKLRRIPFHRNKKNLVTKKLDFFLHLVQKYLNKWSFQASVFLQMKTKTKNNQTNHILFPNDRNTLHSFELQFSKTCAKEITLRSLVRLWGKNWLCPRAFSQIIWWPNKWPDFYSKTCGTEINRFVIDFYLALCDLLTILRFKPI